MITVGIETSCDETSVSVLKNGRLLSNVVSSSIHLHKKYGGVIPEIATRFHTETISYCFKEALGGAGLRPKDIDLVSVTEGPGLIGALLVGISFAKALAYSLDVPLVGVNHVIAHLWANFLSKDRPAFPFIGLAVSGGHTSIMWVKDAQNYKIIGQTYDDAAGEAFDKVSKMLGLGYPGGPEVEKAAKRASSPRRTKFTVSSGRDDALDFSFSGIKTAVLYHIRDRGGINKIDKNEVSQIARDFQEAVCDEIVRKAILACRKKKAKALVVGGGVSANMRLREKLFQEAEKEGIKVFIPPLNLCLDNAAMVASLGSALFKKGTRLDLHMSGFANFNP